MINQKIKTLSQDVNNNKNCKSIIMADEYYNIFKSLKKVNRNESEYRNNLLAIINNNKGERLSLKQLQKNIKNHIIKI